MTQLIKALNWRTLEQRRIDSRLTLMFKITYDLVAITAADYQIPNTRQSRHNHQLAYRQIPTLKDYYKYTFFPRTIVHWNALPFYIPVLPILHPCFTYCGTIQSCCVPSSTRLSLDIRSAFNFLTKTSPLHLFTFFLTFHLYLFYSTTPPPFALVYRTPSDVLHGG